MNELGVSGGNEPVCRSPMPWQAPPHDEQDFFRGLISLRWAAMCWPLAHMRRCMRMTAVSMSLPAGIKGARSPGLSSSAAPADAALSRPSCRRLQTGITPAVYADTLPKRSPREHHQILSGDPHGPPLNIWSWTVIMALVYEAVSYPFG